MRSLLELVYGLRRSGAVAAVICATATICLAQTPANEPPKGLAASSQLALAGFIDRLPDLLDFGLPSFAPRGLVRLYAHPKFGDVLHEDYFRLPVGARMKLSEDIELNTELGTYFTHGFGENVGYGLYETRVGLKREIAISPDEGWSTGLSFVTPLSRPPHGITDGLRHTSPFATYTRSIFPEWGTIGFVTVGADLLDRTSLPVDFRRNQLHANALFLTLGVAREWRRMHVILQVFDGNTALMGSNIHQNTFGIRPSLGIPVLRRRDGLPRATVTFEGRAIWGHDGFEQGINTSVRIDLRYRGDHSRSK